jgi:long-chain acyl-CoA synthetase
MDCRNADRQIGLIEDMLRLYKPFIHDNDYIFSTENVRRLSARLDAAEQKIFAFDVSDLNWRDYWMEVHVPGLEQWCLPLLKNERIDEDPPFPRPEPAPRAEHSERSGGAAPRALYSKEP